MLFCVSCAASQDGKARTLADLSEPIRGKREKTEIGAGREGCIGKPSTGGRCCSAIPPVKPKNERARTLADLSGAVPVCQGARCRAHRACEWHVCWGARLMIAAKTLFKYSRRPGAPSNTGKTLSGMH